MCQRNLRLGGERDIVWHAGFFAASRIVGPFLGQIKLIGNRKAALLCGQRQADRHLAIVLFAKLAAILARHANRMFALLGETRVIDDPIATAGCFQERLDPVPDTA
ncbi:hypothetical protein FQZ97_756850 [compost metagenome]